MSDESSTVTSGHIRPVLDAIESVGHLLGVGVPTIVMIGDQSSGKSSLLESLAGIILRKRLTRVPLIVRLENRSEPELLFNGEVVPTDEVGDAILRASDEIAGNGISNQPLTLVVKKEGVPDLTIVDLPRFMSIPCEYSKHISEIVMEYIKPVENIILNVLSATANNFMTCQSLMMSREVDRAGKRTIAVVTKCDESRQGLFEKVAAIDKKILDCFCVRNRLGAESLLDARNKELALFRDVPHLSKMKCVGFSALSKFLEKTQGLIICGYVSKMDDAIHGYREELAKWPKQTPSFAEDLGSELRNIQVDLAQLLGDFSAEFLSAYKVNWSKDFLLQEIRVLNESREPGLPFFLPKSVFLSLLHENVKRISSIPLAFVVEFWRRVEMAIEKAIRACLLRYYGELLPQSALENLKNLVAKKKKQSVDWVTNTVEMEKTTDYTCNREYPDTWRKSMSGQDDFCKAVRNQTLLVFDGLGDVDLYHLYIHRDDPILLIAFELKMKLTAYLGIVVKRMAEITGLEVLSSLGKLVNTKEIEKFIMNELSAFIADRRRKLKTGIKMLEQTKDVVTIHQAS